MKHYTASQLTTQDPFSVDTPCEVTGGILLSPGDVAPEYTQPAAPAVAPAVVQEYEQVVWDRDANQWRFVNLVNAEVGGIA